MEGSRGHRRNIPRLPRISRLPRAAVAGLSLPGLSLLCWGGAIVVAAVGGSPGLALPPPEDVPEEVLREEVILQGRSPVDGSLLSPVEYAELEAELSAFPEDSVAVNPEIQSLVFQLKLLKLLKDIVPFW